MPAGSVEAGVSCGRSALPSPDRSSYFGPTIRASEQIGAAAQARLRDDLRTVFARYNRATDGTAIVENTYLLTVAVRA